MQRPVFIARSGSSFDPLFISSGAARVRRRTEAGYAVLLTEMRRQRASIVALGFNLVGLTQM